MNDEKNFHPLEGLRLGPKTHPAPVFPQVEQQFAPTCYVRVPDSPIMEPGDPPFENRRQMWQLGPGWVLAYKAVVYYWGGSVGTFAGQWVPNTSLQAFADLQLEINSHDQRLTNSETRSWHAIGMLNSIYQGWLPWLVRVEPGDVWSWSYRYRGLQQTARVEIGLQFVLDSDLEARIGQSKPDPQGVVTLARPLPTRWLTPPSPYPALLAGEQSADRRIDWQQGAGRLVLWSGHSYQGEGEETVREHNVATDATIEVQAAFNDGEHLIQNGTGPDWMSLYLLFGARGGRRVQPLCRKVSSKDQLSVRFRNTGRTIDPPVEAMHPEVVFGWCRDDDLLPRGRA